MNIRVIQNLAIIDAFLPVTKLISFVMKKTPANNFLKSNNFDGFHRGGGVKLNIGFPIRNLQLITSKVMMKTVFLES